MEVNGIHLIESDHEVIEEKGHILNSHDITNHKELFDREGVEKKKVYLQALQSHNNQLLSKIKEFDKRLNTQVANLSKKIVSPSKKRTIVPKIEEFQTSDLRQKFKQLQKIKYQLQMKRTGADSLQFLLSLKEKYSIDLSAVNKNIAAKTMQINHLKKIKRKTDNHESALKKQILRVGEFNVFENEIDELKRKVKEKNQQMRIKKQQFLNMYNKNRSNKTFSLQPLPPIQDQKPIQSDPELIGLKQQYTKIGLRIDLLKSKKARLIKNTVDNSQLLKQLQKLKQKYENLNKIMAK